MTLPLYLLEPDPSAAWAPFAGVRPLAELRAGAFRIRERWQHALRLRAAAVLDDRLTDFTETDEAPVRPCTAAAGPAVVARSDFAPALAAVPLPAGVRRLVAAGETVAWVLAAGERWTGRHDEGNAVPVEGLLLRGSFDLVTALERFLGADCAGLLDAGTEAEPPGSIVFGDPARLAVRGAQVEPGVVFDLHHGAVVIERGAEVRNGTRLEGPCWIGPGTRVLGGLIRASAFGPRCSVRGEIAASSFVGYANKSHDGFVGHSVIGHWVNLGAGTTTSNLKNTYGPVRLQVGGERIETGRTFLGSLIGDHAKTAIGTMLATGTVIGAGANVFGRTAPRDIPPFAWGHEGERLSEDGFLRIAERVLPRRDVVVTPALRQSLAATYRRGAAS